MQNNKSGVDTHCGIGKIKTKYACIVEADEFTKIRLEGVPYRLSQYNLVHKIHPMPQATNFPDAKAAVVKEWRKMEMILACQLTKVRNKTEENQVLWEFSDSESWSVHENEVTGELVANKKRAVKLVASSISDNSGNRKAERRKWPHYFLHILGSRVLHGQSLFDCGKHLRSKTFGRNGRPRRELGYLANVYEYHSSSISSSWSGR